MGEKGFRSAEQDRRIANAVRAGVIDSVDLAAGRARVRLNEDGWTSNDLPWVELAAGAGLRTWSPPTVGEQILVLAPSGELAAGYILRGVNSDAHPAPAQDGQLTRAQWADGARDDYHAGDHVRTISVPAGGRVIILCGDSEIIVDDGEVTIQAASVLLGPDGDRKPVARLGDEITVEGKKGTITSASEAVSAS